MKRHFSSHTIAIYGIYLSLIFLMTFIPNVSYIRFGAIELTIMCIPITIICLHLGWRGAIFGFICFALSSFLRGLAFGSAIIANFGIFEGGIVTLVFSRLLCGVAITFITFALDKYVKRMFIKAIILGALIPLINTLIVISFISLWSGKGFAYWMTIVLTQSMIELSINIVASAIFSLGLAGFIKHNQVNFKGHWHQK